MKYTKNLHNKLLLAGFKFEFEHKEEEEGDELQYTDYKKGFITVSVVDSHQEVVIYLDVDDEELSFLTLEQVLKLDQLINTKQS